MSPAVAMAAKGRFKPATAGDTIADGYLKLERCASLADAAYSFTRDNRYLKAKRSSL